MSRGRGTGLSRKDGATWSCRNLLIYVEKPIYGALANRPTYRSGGRALSDRASNLVEGPARPVKTLFALLLSAVMLGGCGRPDGEQYIHDLGEAIGRADRIEVVEHSSPMDFLDSNAGERPPAKELIYRRVVLTKAQKDGFKSSIEALDPTTQDVFSACLPVEHHRIEFFDKGKLIDSMEICFQCDQVKWSGSSATPPGSLYQGLETLIVSVGMQPKRDWQSLAANGVK